MLPRKTPNLSGVPDKDFSSYDLSKNHIEPFTNVVDYDEINNVPFLEHQFLPYSKYLENERANFEKNLSNILNIDNLDTPIEDISNKLR